MHCPFCSHEETKVLESRISESSLRRRRECIKCENRFTTYEKAHFNFSVIKKDNKEEHFMLDKIISSISKACGKTDDETVQNLAKKVQQKILAKKVNPIRSSTVGMMVLRELHKFDTMAYVRYTTIHTSIKNIKLLEKELQTI
jgi:transcriptional repressor NrdR